MTRPSVFYAAGLTVGDIQAQDQAVVVAKQELLRHPDERAEPGDQRVFEGARGRGGLTRARQLPAQKLAGVAVDDQGQRRPAVPPGPDPASVGRPTLVGRLGPRGHRLDPGSHPDRPLSDLPALDLEDPLDRVLVEAQKPGHGAISTTSAVLRFAVHRLIGSSIVTLIATLLLVA